MSDDGQFGLTLIAFVGSVFSPYYAWARRQPQSDPDHFCALNVALYSRHANRWSMTERGRRHCHRDATQFKIGPSEMHWTGNCLEIAIDEVCVPFPRKIKGRIRLFPHRLFDFSTPLDAAGAHRWGPIAPHAAIEVDLQEPQQQWRGSAYMDSNEGDEPIERGFHHWDWSRSQLRDGSTAVIYDMQWPDQPERVLSLRFDREGKVDSFQAPQRQKLPSTLWRVKRNMRSPSPVKVVHQLKTPLSTSAPCCKTSCSARRSTAFTKACPCRAWSPPLFAACCHGACPGEPDAHRLFQALTGRALSSERAASRIRSHSGCG